MELNESAVLLMLNPSVDHTRKDLPVDVYETGELPTSGLTQVQASLMHLTGVHC